MTAGRDTMSAHKLNISRIEELITEYASKFGINENARKMMKITEDIKLKKYIGFNETLFLACTLGVAPDYITGVSCEKEFADTNLMNILSHYICLNDDCRYSLAKKSKEYMDIQENFADFESADIEVEYYDCRYHKTEEYDFYEPELSLVAENKAEYRKDE